MSEGSERDEDIRMSEIVRKMLADAVATWRVMRAFGHSRRVTFRAILNHMPGDYLWYRGRTAIGKGSKS